MIETIRHSVSHHFIEHCQIHDHAGFPIYRSTHEHLNNIVVSMAMGVVAFSIRGLILLRREGACVQPMARTEHIAAAKISSHACPLYSAKISGVAYSRTQVKRAPPAAVIDGS